GVPCDRCCRTPIPSVLAVGDCALPYDPDAGVHATVEHWDAAARQGALTARTLLGLPEERRRAPYFWSDQAGVKLQVIGRTGPADAVEIEDLDTPRTFVARYLRDAEPIGVLAAGAPRAIAQARRQLEQGTRKELTCA
ncbi:MAG: oxidoreductase C-terminal domain-containing protein, partial [Thermoleophilaceae bacterium]